MDLERLNGWLGLLGQLAVLGGLIALAIEIRGNTKSLRAQEIATITQQDFERQLMLLDPDVRADYTQALFDPENLTLDQVYGASMLLNYRVSTLQSVYMSVQDGVLKQADFHGYVDQAGIYLGTRFGRRWWERTKGDFVDFPGQEFVDAIERSIRETTILPDDVYYVELCKAVSQSDCNSSQ